jgi:hypothetical protein
MHLRPKHQGAHFYGIAIIIIIIIITTTTTTSCVLSCNILHIKDDLVEAICCQYVSNNILKL